MVKKRRSMLYYHEISSTFESVNIMPLYLDVISVMHRKPIATGEATQQAPLIPAPVTYPDLKLILLDPHAHLASLPEAGLKSVDQTTKML